MIDIDKHIPIPLHRPGNGRSPKYPFAEMEIGDSILVPVVAAQAATKWKQRHPLWNYVSRVENGQLRIWRTE